MIEQTLQIDALKLAINTALSALEVADHEDKAVIKHRRT